MTFVQPNEEVTGPNPNDQSAPIPGDIVPQNDHPGFSDAEWTEIQANLDSHYTDLYGSGQAAGTQPVQTGAPQQQPVAGLGNQPPAAGVPVLPAEFDLGAVKVPADDAAALGQLYTFIRNNPEKAAAITGIIQGNAPVAPAPPPIWQHSNQQPQQPPVVGWPVATPPPPAQGVQIVPPEVLESMDPATRYMFDRVNQIDANQKSVLEMMDQSRRAEAQRVANEAINQRVQTDTVRGISRFRTAHPELTDDQFAAINQHTQRLGIIGGLLTQLPGDQAVARAFELARLDLGSSLTGAPLAPTVPADVTRQRTLTSLAGGSSGSIPRQEPPAPVDTAPDPDLTRAKKAAVAMLAQSGINLADNL